MSYRKIFSVVNEHTASTVTARYALSLATACKAELFLYAAHDGRCNETILHRTDLHMDHLYSVASKLNIPVTRITEVGNISKLLPKRVQAENADLVCFPLTPDERYGAGLRTNKVNHLLKEIRPDLAIIRAMSMAKPHPGNILVPLGKFINDRERRLLFIAGLAKSFQARVTLFHLPEKSESQGMPDDITSFRKELQQQNVTVLERRGRGDIGKAITVEAITRHNDLIVLGASRRGLVRSLFFGNPAGDIMHQPPCNAILFRPALSEPL